MQPVPAANNHVRLAYQGDDADVQLNADFARPARAALAAMPWEASPQPGVERKRLELVGASLPRLTTLVRFAPGSHFAEHGHDGGEEFIVLAGTFSDHTGDFDAGSYVRNPVGFVHTPYTDAGCTILVKLRQFQPDDRQRVIVDTRATDQSRPDAQGHAWLELHRHGSERVRLCMLCAGAAPLQLTDAGGVELLVLEGEVQIDGEVLRPPHWLRLPAGAACTLEPSGHCRLWIKQGHLPA